MDAKGERHAASATPDTKKPPEADGLRGLAIASEAD